MPSFVIEQKAGGRVAGVDEVGRGPLAGPVVAAAVIFAGRPPRKVSVLIDDSKKLDAPARRTAAAALWALAASGRAEIAVGAASVEEIERLNIFHASMLAMQRAISRLSAPPDLALIDGNHAPRLTCATDCIVGGDATCLSIAAASIIAKVMRDFGMVRLDARCPGYGWAENVGYSTPGHRAALRRLGPTRHHRTTFASVRAVLDAADLSLASALTATIDADDGLSPP